MISSRIRRAWIDVSRTWEPYAEITLADGTFVANGKGEALELQNKGTAALTLAVTAITGTNPYLDVEIETSADGVTDWALVDGFQRLAVIGSTRKVFVGLDAFVRVAVYIGGTGNPSVTASVIGKAY